MNIQKLVRPTISSVSSILCVIMASGCNRYDLGVGHEKWVCLMNNGVEVSNYAFISDQPYGSEIRWIDIDDIPVSTSVATSEILKIGERWTWTIPPISNPLPRKEIMDRPNKLAFALNRRTGTLLMHEIDDLSMARVRTLQGNCSFLRMSEPYP